MGNLADALIDSGRYAEAILRAQASVKIGEEIGDPVIGCDHNRSLALAHFTSDNLPAAREAATAARQYDAPHYLHAALVLLGVITLRQGDKPAAQEAFSAAAAQAESLLAQTPQFLSALDSKGLALCGLAVGSANEFAAPARNQRIDEARAAFIAARAINKEAGIVGRVLRLFDALALMDTGGVLAGVRTTIAAA